MLHAHLWVGVGKSGEQLTQEGKNLGFDQPTLVDVIGQYRRLHLLEEGGTFHQSDFHLLLLSLAIPRPQSEPFSLFTADLDSRNDICVLSRAPFPSVYSPIALLTSIDGVYLSWMNQSLRLISLAPFLLGRELRAIVPVCVRVFG